MRSVKILAVAAVLASSLFFLVSRQVAQSQGLVLNPNVSTYACGTGCANAAAQIIGQNPTRRSIQICNPSAVIVWIAPGSTTAVANGAGSIGLPAVSSGTTTCYTPPNGFSNFVGNSWNVVGASTPFNMTVYEFN